MKQILLILAVLATTLPSCRKGLISPGNSLDGQWEIDYVRGTYNVPVEIINDDGTVEVIGCETEPFHVERSDFWIFFERQSRHKGMCWYQNGDITTPKEPYEFKPLDKSLTIGSLEYHAELNDGEMVLKINHESTGVHEQFYLIKHD